MVAHLGAYFCKLYKIRSPFMPKIPSTHTFTTVLAITFAIFSSRSFAMQENDNTVAGMNIENLRASGYRLDWMNQSNSTELHLPTITEDSIYTLDSEDFITRYELETGKWLWSAPVGNQVFSIRSINEAASHDYVYIVSDGAVYVLERETGNQPASPPKTDPTSTKVKSLLPLDWVANTGAITPTKELLIYGSSNGDVVWFDPTIGFVTKRYKIGNIVRVQPTFAEGPRTTGGQTRKVIIAPAVDGQVFAVDLKQASKTWSIQLTNPVETEIICATQTTPFEDEKIPRTSAFIAGTDQYVRSIDLHSGKHRWKFLTSSHLADSPTVINEKLYQRIPGIGLASFNAFPRALSGEQNWVAKDVLGNVITTTKNGQLVCWDEKAHLLQIVDPRKGGIVSTLSVPSAKELITDSNSEGSIYILTQDNGLLRLVSRQ
jgi:outer membrane protein assembly factor BamB